MQEKLEKYFRNLLIPFILVPRSEFRNFLFASFFCHWDVVRKKNQFRELSIQNIFSNFSPHISTSQLFDPIRIFNCSNVLIRFDWKLTKYISIKKNFQHSGLSFSRSLKVNKSQGPLPKKQMKYLTKFCPMKLGQNSVKYFVRFWAVEFQEKTRLRFTDI